MLLDNLSDLFQRGLEYAWDCEHLLAKDLPRMVEAASSTDLKRALDFQLAETKSHIYRLEQIFTRLERAPAGEKSEAVRIILRDCEKMMAHIEPSPLLDAVVIFSGNQVAHYGIGLYGSLVALARTLELEEIANLLEQTLAEERTSGQSLTRVADRSVNVAAKSVHNPPPFALI